jgi:hypothetical protein
MSTPARAASPRPHVRTAIVLTSAFPPRSAHRCASGPSASHDASLPADKDTVLQQARRARVRRLQRRRHRRSAQRESPLQRPRRAAAHAQPFAQDRSAAGAHAGRIRPAARPLGRSRAVRQACGRLLRRRPALQVRQRHLWRTSPAHLEPRAHRSRRPFVLGAARGRDRHVEVPGAADARGTACAPDDTQCRCGVARAACPARTRTCAQRTTHPRVRAARPCGRCHERDPAQQLPRGAPAHFPQEQAGDSPRLPSTATPASAMCASDGMRRMERPPGDADHMTSVPGIMAGTYRVATLACAPSAAPAARIVRKPIPGTLMQARRAMPRECVGCGQRHVPAVTPLQSTCARCAHERLAHARTASPGRTHGRSAAAQHAVMQQTRQLGVTRAGSA